MRNVLFFLFLFLFTGATHAHGFFDLFSSMPTVTASNGVITIEAKKLAAGESKHYQYKENGTTIRFFLVRDSEGTLHAALDACDVCWRADKGYQMQEGAMVCMNCGMRFALSRIGSVKGGCNPHPIVFTLEGDTFSIASQELMDGAGYFPGNK